MRFCSHPLTLTKNYKQKKALNSKKKDFNGFFLEGTESLCPSFFLLRELKVIS